ncbi:MAG: hypothetical protein NWF13_04835 [Candidatus Bathyarchaeota archaeon]|nr:hypothetical protein [Candidatus Bathyarchaeota archaeon]
MSVLPSRLTVKEICLIIVLAALCVGSSYALIGLPNVNVMDLIVFVTSYVFGVPIGVTTGVLARAVFGSINPLGFNLLIWVSTVLGGTVFGVVGGILGRMTSEPTGKPFNLFRFNLEMGLWGLVLTILYDLFTNIAFAVAFKVPIAAAIVSGWLLPPWFGILHAASNVLLFFFAVYPLTNAIRTFRGGENA